MIGQLILILCGCALAAIAFGLLVRKNEVHGSLFLAMLAAAKRLGMGEIAIISSPRAPKGMVYVLEKQNLMDSLHLTGQAVDVALSSALAERFFRQYEDFAPYEYQLHFMGNFRPGAHAIIKNLTDGGE